MLSPRPSSRIQPLYVTFLVHSWSNNCYLGFQIAVLVTIRAAYFQAVADRNCAVTAAVSNRVCESVPLNALVLTGLANFQVVGYSWPGNAVHAHKKACHIRGHLKVSVQLRSSPRAR
jgi:hypothetical protein